MLLFFSLRRGCELGLDNAFGICINSHMYRLITWFGQVVMRIRGGNNTHTQALYQGFALIWRLLYKEHDDLELSVQSLRNSNLSANF